MLGKRRGGAHMGFSERIDTTLKWSELTWTPQRDSKIWCINLSHFTSHGLTLTQSVSLLLSTHLDTICQFITFNTPWHSLSIYHFQDIQSFQTVSPFTQLLQLSVKCYVLNASFESTVLLPARALIFIWFKQDLFACTPDIHYTYTSIYTENRTVELCNGQNQLVQGQP